MVALIFYGFAALSLMTATFVILARNPVHSVFSLILTFFNVAGLFILLGAEFLAMILVIVYVGAIAVLFLFVVMMMNLPEQKSRLLMLRRAITQNCKALGYFGFLAINFYVFYAPLYYISQKGFEIMLTPSYGQGYRLFAGHPFIAFPVGLVALYFTALFYPISLFHVFRTLVKEMSFSFLLFCLFVIELFLLGITWHTNSVAYELIASPTPPLKVLTNTHALGNVLYTDYFLVFQGAGLILLVAIIGVITLTHRPTSRSRRQDPRKQLQRQKAEALEIKTLTLGKGWENVS